MICILSEESRSRSTCASVSHNPAEWRSAVLQNDIETVSRLHEANVLDNVVVLVDCQLRRRGNPLVRNTHMQILQKIDLGLEIVS